MYSIRGRNSGIESVILAQSYNKTANNEAEPADDF